MRDLLDIVIAAVLSALFIIVLGVVALVAGGIKLFLDEAARAPGGEESEEEDPSSAQGWDPFNAMPRSHKEDKWY